MTDDRNRWLEQARAVMNIEADAVRQAGDRFDDAFIRAVELILEHSGKVIVTGLGKSAHIAQKLAATLSSLGTPAIFLHGSDAFHGDLGLYSLGDPTIIFSKSGTTQEILRLVPILKTMGSPTIGILGNTRSPLSSMLDVVIDASVRAEADVNNLAPTTSTTVSLAIADALACTVAQAKGFKPEDFAKFHPGGQLGRNLHTLVGDVAHCGETVAWVSPDASIKHVVIALTQRPLGAACVVDESHRLIGIITDGDLRRALLTHDDIRGLRVTDVMTAHPVTVSLNAPCSEAIALMENRKSQISVLPVMDPITRQCVGLIRIHDIYSAKEA